MKIRRELIAQRDPKSPVSEVFRTLRTNIQFMNTNKKLRTLLIASTFPGEGKSLVASNIAVTFAQAGNKVILIDADMRKGRQYTIFGVSPRPGLSNYLSGIDEEKSDEIDISKYIQKTEVENLLLMPAGNIPPNPSELLVSPQMTKLLEDLKEVCDIIIIDGTPCKLVTDSLILTRIVDSTVVVTAYKETRKDSLERVIKNIQNVGGHLAGIVVNKMPISNKKYSDGYYYYYSSGTSLIPAKERANEIRKKNDNISRQNADVYHKEKYNQDKYQPDVYHQEAYNTDVYRQETFNQKNDDLEKPNFIKNNDTPNSTIEKTSNILDQINSYLDQEKKNLN